MTQGKDGSPPGPAHPPAQPGDLFQGVGAQHPGQPGAHPPGAHPPGAHPPGAHPPGAHPPGYGAPGYGPPNYGPPGAQPPGYGPPGYGPPGYGPPGYGPPGYGPPGAQPPGYGPPGAHPPGYGPPGAQPPGYGPPGAHPPGYAPPGPPGYPPGNYPPGNYPPGNYPPGNYPGYAPTLTRNPIPLHNPKAIKERSGAMVLLLMLFTCGIYYLYWIYATSKELKEALNDAEIKPGIDLLLTIVTCFLWGIYLEHRNAQRAHAALLSKDPYAKDQSEIILICNIATFFVGATWLVASYILQEEYNKLSRY